MATYVLVHGSWHDGSTWMPVIRELESRGHAAHAPTLPGHGKDRHKAVTHDDYVTSVVDYLGANDLSDVVLLGHSFGGSVIARVAEETPDQLRRLVFWNAFVPRPGTCVMDDLPPNYRELFASLAAASEDNTFKLPFPVWREAFIQDADLELAQSTYELLSAEPFGPFRDQLGMDRFYNLEIPRSYLNCLEDIALPPGEWGWHPRMSSRLGLYRLVQMHGNHEALFTDHAGLAEKIIQAGRD